MLTKDSTNWFGTEKQDLEKINNCNNYLTMIKNEQILIKWVQWRWLLFEQSI